MLSINKSAKLIVYIAFFVFTCLAQAELPDKGLVHIKKSRLQPFEIVEVKFRNQVIRADEEFSASIDWLKDLEVSVKNISQYTINYIEIQIEFSRDSDNNPILPVRMLFAGQNLLMPINTPKTGDWLNLQTSQTISLKMKDFVFEAHQNDVMKKQLSLNISKRITLRPKSAAFSNGKAWYRGNFMSRDPNNPNSWLIDKKQASIQQKMSKTDTNTPMRRVYISNLPPARCYIPVAFTYAYCDEMVPCLYPSATLQRVDVGHFRVREQVTCTNPSGQDCLGVPISDEVVDEESECTYLSTNNHRFKLKSKIALRNENPKKRKSNSINKKQESISIR
jgi:hypothetical protein